MTAKPFLLGCLVVWLVGSAVSPSLACQYCRMAATDPEAARMAAQMHSGGFPLDATINQFQGSIPPAVLTAPPNPDCVATSAADLPVPAARLHAPAGPLPATVTARAAGPVVTARETSKSARWSDAGLLGLAAAGGWFCWRTRRMLPPVS